MRTDFKEKMGLEWEAIIKLGALEVQVQQFPVSWTWVWTLNDKYLYGTGIKKISTWNDIPTPFYIHNKTHFWVRQNIQREKSVQEKERQSRFRVRVGYYILMTDYKDKHLCNNVNCSQ